ncbi:hypothetical protein NPX13_g2180 [Xylaria arbuscula]|uniref:Uncharacterized protein n=1 Tax=Xylaria arbuscula TaxID=114810 RepID=A0A9W8TQL3_9PEZI|nr:hypothetical protein NPX13_g2180 [Xylaria arbuscula]
METDTWNSSSTSSSRCPHSYEKGVPICWDCTEEGHVASSPQEGESAAYSPAWQRLRRFRKSLGFWDASLRNSSVYHAGSQASTLELRPPEQGLEVASPGDRRSQPGLIVVTGPQVVSAEEKYLKPEPKTWATETLSKEESLRSSFPISPVESEPEEKRRIWGFQRRTFWILVAIAILALLGLIIGIAVGVSKQKNTHSTSLAPIDEDQVSSIPPPMSSTGITITETVSLSVASRSSTLITLLKTETPSSSSSSTRQGSKPTTTTTATGGGREGGDAAKTAPIIATV